MELTKFGGIGPAKLLRDKLICVTSPLSQVIPYQELTQGSPFNHPPLFVQLPPLVES